MKLNKGDKVLIKNLQEGISYGFVEAYPKHTIFSNKIVTVAAMSGAHNCFYIKEDKHNYAFSFEMIEKIVPSLYDRMNIVRQLFSSIITDNYNNIIDNETTNRSKIFTTTRAYYIAREYTTLNIEPTKDDLLYINKTIKKLVDILGTDIDVINVKYVAERLKITEMPYSPHEDWLTAYKQLLELI